MRSLLIVTLCLFVVSGCAKLPPPPPASQATYHLDSGDKVRVIVYGETSLSTDYMVGDNGMISFPMVGEIKAQSLTAQDLQRAIAEGLLHKGVLANPSVSVEISQYRPFYVLGEVGKPGLYPYTTDLTLLSAVATAGGYTVRADKDAVTVVRNQGGQPAEWHAERLMKVEPGDVINVPERFP